MTSKKDKDFWDIKDKEEPKTPHEEIMFCIESTNDIVSKILNNQIQLSKSMLKLIKLVKR